MRRETSFWNIGETEKKYTILRDKFIINNFGKKLYRIQALTDFNDVKAGDLGGFVEGYHNLSQGGYSWIYGIAQVFDKANIHGDAFIICNPNDFGITQIYENARIGLCATVGNGVKISGEVYVSGYSNIYGNVIIKNNVLIDDKVYILNNNLNIPTEISGNAKLCGSAHILGSPIIKDFASVNGFALITDKVVVKDKAKIAYFATIGGNAVIRGTAKIGGQMTLVGDMNISRGTINEEKDLRLHNFAVNLKRKISGDETNPTTTNESPNEILTR